MAKIRAFCIFTLLLLSSSFFLQVVRSQSESDSDMENAELVAETVEEGIVGDDTQDFGFGNYNPAPGVETVCVFPKNIAKFVVAGQETELLIGVKNEGEQNVKVLAVHASVHLPYDHRMLVQNLSTVAFNDASVPASVQATFPYIFAVSKFLQAGTFDLVGTIVYEIDQVPYQNTFYNGTIEVTEAGGFVSVETVFLVSLGLALLVLAGLWVRTQLQLLSKKTKKITKVEVGTRTVDASMDEWLQVCISFYTLYYHLNSFSSIYFPQLLARSLHKDNMILMILLNMNYVVDVSNVRLVFVNKQLGPSTGNCLYSIPVEQIEKEEVERGREFCNRHSANELCCRMSKNFSFRLSFS